MGDRFQVDLQQLPRITRDLQDVDTDLTAVLNRLRVLESSISAQVAPAQRARAQIGSARHQVDAVGRELQALQNEIRRRAQELTTAEAELVDFGRAGLVSAGPLAAAATSAADEALLGQAALLKDASMLGKLGKGASPKAYDMLTMRRHDMRDSFRGFGRFLNAMAGSKRAGWVGRMDQLSRLVPHVQARTVPDWVQPTGKTLGRGVLGVGLLTTFTDELSVEERSGRTGVLGTAEAASTTSLGALAKVALKTAGSRALKSEVATTVARTVGERVAPRLATRAIPGVGEVLMVVDGVHLASAGLEWVFDETGHHDLARGAAAVKDVTDIDKHIRDVIRPAEDWFIGNVLDNSRAQSALQLGQLPLP